MHRTSRLPAPLAVSVLLAAVTGLLSAPILAQSKPTDDSAQGETLAPEASPAKQGVYLSDWFNQDLTLIGSKDISFGPKPTDDIYLEYEYFGRKGPFELYGYIDVPKILTIGNSNDKGVWDHGSPVFMEHEPRISIDYLAGRSLAVGPFKEWYVAFDWIYDHGSNKENRANTLYSGLGTDIETHSRVNLSANFYGRYQWENYGASNEYSWDGYRAQMKYIVPIGKFDNGASLTYIGFTNYDFGSDLHKDNPAHRQRLGGDQRAAVFVHAPALHPGRPLLSQRRQLGGRQRVEFRRRQLPRAFRRLGLLRRRGLPILI